MRERLRAIADKVGVGVLADRSGIGLRTLQTYLSGRSKPSAENVAKIVLASGEDANWVLLGHKRPEALDEQLFMRIFSQIHKPDTSSDAHEALLKSDLAYAMKIYNQACSAPDKADSIADLILTRGEKELMCRLINNESSQYAETPEERDFVKRQVQRYESRLSELDKKEDQLVREIGADYKV